MQPSIDAFKAALSSSDWARSGSFSSTLTDMPGKGGWPITMRTFVVVPQVTQKPEQTLHALQFFVWAFMNGDALVPQSNFVRLPDLEGAPRGGALMGEAGRLASTHMQRPGAYFEQE